MKSLESRRKKVLDSFDEIDEMKKKTSGTTEDREDELKDIYELLKAEGMLSEIDVIEANRKIEEKTTSKQRRDFLDSIKVDEKNLNKENVKKEGKSTEQAKADILKKLGVDR